MRHEQARRRAAWLGLMVGLYGCVWGWRAGPAKGADTPTKLTVMVPMRDGALLATDVYLPAGDGPWPVAFARTPRKRSTIPSENNIPVSRFNESGIVLVAQDERGSGASGGGPWQLYVDDGWGQHQDGFDTVAWIRSQAWCNGKIATFGGSALGINQLLLAGAGPEGVVGQHIQVGAVSPYQYWDFTSGVYRLGNDGWPPPGLWLLHPHYDDFWRGLDLRTRLDHVHWPLVHVGGWFDIGTQGTIEAFTQLQEQGGDGAKGQQHLIMGPWTHPGTFNNFDPNPGDLHFPANARFPADAPTRFQWLSFWLTGQPAIPADEPVVRYYVMGDVSDPGAPGNVWRTAASWPPPSQPLRLYFTADGGLDAQPPAASATREYDYNPAKPVPTRGGDYDGSKDQRSVESRPDVLVFSTPVLTQPLEVTGRISVRLYAATSAADTDFTAKLTDVYPNGRSMLIADNIVRARYRRSLDQEEPITPGQPYAYDIDLWSTSLIFNKGHQIRVAISSSNAPRFQPNPNTGGPWPFDPKVKPVVAHQTIYLGAAEASYIVLPEVVASAGQ